MRSGRTIQLIVLLAALVAWAAFTPAAFADAGGGDSTAPPVTDDSSSGSTDSTVSTPSTPSTTEPPSTTPPTTSVPEEGPNVVPTTPEALPTEAPGGGGQLPFTGPGDVLLAAILAMLAASAGFALMVGASGQAQLDALRRRTIDSPSPFRLAYRELLRQQDD